MIKTKEMLIGLRETFYYARCRDCGSLNMLNVPKDLSKYYPDEYSSGHKFSSSFIDYVNALLYKLYVYYHAKIAVTKTAFGETYNPHSNLESVCLMLRISGRSSYNGLALLDIGTRTGTFLKKLQFLGFDSLVGIDPFIDEPTNPSKDIEIQKKDVFHVKQKFDYIVMNHSLEHMKNPLKVIKKVRALIKNGGVFLVRMPVADSYAFDRYKQFWNGLDPSRHLVIFTRKAMEIAAKKSHFSVVKMVSDSTGDNIKVSELYKMGIPLWHASKNIFTKEQLAYFDSIAKKYNDTGRGDSVAFYLKPV